MNLSNQTDLEHEAEKIKDIKRNATEELSFLVVENSPGEQFAIHLAIAARIERIRREQIQVVGDINVIQYQGGALPILSIEQGLKVTHRPDTRFLYLIIITMGKREVGIMVSNIVDIVDVSTDIDESTFKQEGVMGSAIIQDRITLLLDVYGLVRKIMPDWSKEHKEIQENVKQKELTVLVVEDSSFFQTQIREMLEDIGVKVLMAEDGQLGLETFLERNEEINLVLTDVEMPRMDGLEMTRNIRSDSRFDHTPIIALTSLASEEDMDKGKGAGVTEYLIKMDQEQVTTTVLQLLNT